MKKFFSLVLALVMALSLTTVAWGADLTCYVSAIGNDSTGDGTMGNPYATLEKAVEAVNAYTGSDTYVAIQLDSVDVTLTADMTLPCKLVVDTASAVTFDLGGKSLIGRVNLVKGNLTVKNGTVNGNGGQALNVYGSATAAQNYSVLNVESNVTVTNASIGVVVFGPFATSKDGHGAVVNLKGTVNNTGVGVFVSGNLGNDNSAATSNNIVNVYGQISASGQGVALNGAATVNVYNGASITGSEAIGVKRGTLNVSGGTLTATGAKDDTPAENAHVR